MAQSWFLGTNPLNQLGSTMGMGLPSAAQQQQSFEAAGAQAAAFFDEERRRWDDNYRQKQDQIDQQYELSKRSLKTAEAAQALDDWYKRESAGLARERLSQDKYEFDQTHDLNNRKFGQQQHEFAATLGQRQSEFDRSFGLNQAQLGYDVMNMGAQLRGPENYYQAADFARGVAGQPQTATFLQALQNNTRLSDFGAQGGLPNPETLGTLQAKLTGGNAAGNAYHDNSLASIGNIAAKGAHQIGAGGLESLTDTERSLFSSGLDKLGIDKATFLNQHRRSRVGQGFGTTRAA
jgi:hypothetical protein